MNNEDLDLDFMNPYDDEVGSVGGHGDLMSPGAFDDDLDLDSDLDNLPI